LESALVALAVRGDFTMDPNETRIAHLSDVHMLGAAPSEPRGSWSFRHRFLSLGRPLDPAARRRRLALALAHARSAGADRIVISGDLTEVGLRTEFVALGESLHESGFAPDCVTLVPGNHDLYSSPEAWHWAIHGPLAAFAATSATETVGRIIECGSARLLPVDATFHQPMTRSAGALSRETLDAIERCASDPGLADMPLIVVQHHPPFPRGTGVWRWIDGLAGAHRMMAILREFRHLCVMHGHLHTLVTRSIGDEEPRILGATAVVEDQDVPRVRVFDAYHGQLRPVVRPSFASEPRRGRVPALAPFARSVAPNLEAAL
jgi:3',5'-cyclic AMP phosphodiesterase CpdA